jgi:ADP-heptose:LPS heptosyltransferase
MYSRHPSFDKIIKYSRANNKIGFYGDLSRSTEASRSATTKYYTNIFHSNPNTRFEFEVNKSFFEYILQKKILLSKPNIETSFINCDLTKNIIPNSKPYIIVFPGGSHSSRKYSSNNYSVIINHILRNTSYNIMVLGSESDKGDCNEIMEKVGANDYRLINLCGKTNLIELVYYIKTAALLISNDTSAVHIGAATNTKVITISNGQHIGRFSPYPSNIFADNIAVYPPAIQEQFDNKKELNSLYNKFSYGSNLNINDIDPFQIICKVEYLLNT